MEGSQAMPARIGSYRILEILGEGGMGMVYLGVQKEHIRRRVAIKVIKLGMASREFLNRFEAERQALAMMTHNNIARVYEAGATEEGQPYLVMEYAPGLSLVDHCDQHKLGTRDRLSLFRQVCEGVQHAHHKGVIHRDLKPANVLVTMQQGEPVPKIIDFGLARATDHRLTEATIYTEQGRVIGTPEYMSPEQAEMSTEGIDTRTDVYSLGVMLYELLVGDLPFPAEELRLAGLLEIRRKICMDEPAKPSTRLSNLGEASAKAAALRRTTPAALIRELRSDLDWVVMHAVEKDRDHRYATAAALEEDISRYLKGEVVSAGPPSARYRLQKFVRRHRAKVGGAIMAGVLLIGWMISATYLYFDAEAARKEADENASIAQANADEAIRERNRAAASEREARAAEQRAAAEAEVAVRVADFLVELFEYSRPDKALGQEIPVRMVLDQGARRIETELRDQPAVRAKLLDTLARVYYWLGNTERAESLIKESIRLQEDLHGGNSHEVLVGRTFLADVQILGGSYEAALTGLEEVDSLAASNRDVDQFFFVSTRSLHANALRQLGRHEEAEIVLEEALLEYERAGPGPNRDMCICIGSLAGLLHDTGRFQQARRRFEEAIAMEQLVFPEGHPSRISTLHNYSRTLTKLGEYELAEENILKALSEGERVYGPDNPNLATVLVALGSFYNSMGQQREAEAPLTRALEIQRANLDPKHPSLAWSLNDLGLQFFSMGKLAKAKELMSEAVEIYREVFEEHLYLAISLGNLADIHAALGEYGDAERLALESLAMKRAISAGDANIASALGSLSDLYIKTGRLEDARKAAQEAVDLLIALPEEKPRLAHTHNFLALIANISGDGDLGERHARVSLRLLNE
ncbi:MAG: serine/threonine-protein kinase, partial [Planctomycetota bacterium]